jgi:hypothetical protein
MKNKSIFIFLSCISGMLFTNNIEYKKGTTYRYQNKSALFYFYYDATLYTKEDGTSYMLCNFHTRYKEQEKPALWVFKAVENNRVTVCKEDAQKGIFYAFLPEYSKALLKKLKSFDKLASKGNLKKSEESFFSIRNDALIKMPGARHYVYVFFSKNGKESCYEKFKEIFGPEALVEFKKLN